MSLPCTGRARTGVRNNPTAITAFVPGRAAVDLQLVFWLCQQHGPRHFLDLEF